jgi:hypothetical protein
MFVYDIAQVVLVELYGRLYCTTTIRGLQTCVPEHVWLDFESEFKVGFKYFFCWIWMNSKFVLTSPLIF